MTYISSTPIPRRRNGIVGCISAKNKPRKKHNPKEATNDIPMTNKPWRDKNTCKQKFVKLVCLKCNKVKSSKTPCLEQS